MLVSLDDLGYGQMNFDKRSFDPKTMENRKTVETYTISIAKAIEAAKKSTPTLNKLMSEGVKLTNGYVAHGVSGPSRAAIMTGRSPARYGVYSNIDAEEGISLSETFLPELFQNHGYYTAAIGKWHMSKISSIKAPKNGRSRDYHDNYIQFSSEETQPQNRGFDYFMGFHNHGAAYYNSPALFKNREQIKAVGYISDQFTTESIGVVNRAKMLEQPFLLYLAFNAPHLPNDAPAPIQYQSKFNTGSPTADNFYASIYAADQGLNRILEQMKKNGQYDNTMILFTSDNGAVIDGPLPLNGAQKGYKGQTTTGGTHTPMFIWYGGRLHQGSDYNKLVSAMDLFPTALDVAGIAVPNNLDGVSLLPYLQGDKKGNPHQNLYWMTSYPHHFDEGNIAFWNGYHKFIRYESDDYPFNPNTEALSEFSWTIRNNDFMLMYLEESGEYGMYKLNDLRQEHNLIKMNPKTFVQMKEDMKKFIASTKKPNNPITLPKYERIKRSSLK
ncbi:sulfatase family protein [Psychromonas sp. CD1]|uniref:sulfatase family protein n=1 Tax=Psychromonas sp. CD1 TaxID=1979839 RepID=UPI0021511F81|nr:sulfatase [Psychromonas sp. CD1]